MKILYTASVLSHICQFHLPTMEALQKDGNIIHVAARDNLAEKNGLQLQFVDEYYDIPFQRSPKDKQNIIAYKELKALLEKEHYDIVICNTPVVGVLTRLAAKQERKKGTKVVYIAHGFHFYKGAPKKYWFIYPIEKILADYFTDLLVTINKEDYVRAKRHFKTNVKHIYGIGVRTGRYNPASVEERSEYRKKENLKENDFVIICSKELMYDNDQSTLLRAVASLKNKLPVLKILLAGNGPDEQKLKSLASELGISDIVRLLGYRTDLEKVVPAADLVVSCSWREGMPLNIIEAMLSARPIVASHNRGHNELIQHEKTGYLFNIKDSEELSKYILKVYEDKEKAELFGRRAYKKAQKYTSDSVVKQIKTIIDELEEK